MLLIAHKPARLSRTLSVSAGLSLAGAGIAWALYSLLRSGTDRSASVRALARKALERLAPRLWKTRTAPEPSAPPESPEPLPHPGPQAARDWIHAVHEAMGKDPRDFGFDKLEWNAPLLRQYLEKEHGLTLPVHRIREALKESGYEWRYSRYRKVRA